MVERFALGSTSRVIEIAANDGYLLQDFAARDIPVVGVESAANLAAAAQEAIVGDCCAESSASLARSHGQAA